MQTGELTLQMALIVAVGVFLASFTDAHWLKIQGINSNCATLSFPSASRQ